MTRVFAFAAGLIIGGLLAHHLPRAVGAWIAHDLDRAGIGYLDGSDG